MSSNNNNGKVAVLTGSSRGIGKAIANQFVKNGYPVVPNARDEGDLKKAADDIAKEAGNGQMVSYIAGDISEENICISLIQEAVKRFGRVDVLINNAGISGVSKKINEIASDDWDYVIDVNLKGAFL